MFKKLIPILLLSISLSACSKVTDEIPKESTEISTDVTISDNINLNKTITLSGKTLSYNKYLSIENLLFFPDPLNNNNLSLAKISSSDTSVANNAIIEFYPYSLISILKNATNNIYFSSNSEDSGLFELDYVNYKITKLHDSIPLEMIYIENKIIYINSEDRFIYCYDLDKKENSLLSSNKSSNLLYNNSYILYKNLDDNSKIYSINLDGTNNNPITDVSVDSLAVLNNILFYFDSENNNILCSIDPSTKKVTKYMNIMGHNLKEYDEVLYYISTENPNSLYSLLQSSDSESFENKLIYSDFVNDYFINDNGIYIEKASNIDGITIIKN